MPDPLHVVALISGGKDSLFSLLHCLQNGHTVVALANLYPPLETTQLHEGQLESNEVESTDLNSFMYQTVGHSLIPLYAQVLQLPLYRRQISGSSVQQSQYYDTSSSSTIFEGEIDSDETEDLIPLLRQVLSAHPEVNAVSTGAILSTYQRTRIESIAIRLGLTPLSYLWQYPSLPPPVALQSHSSQNLVSRLDSLTGLLEDMASAGLDARIIKIASAGIPEKLLFANVADKRTQSHLVNGLAPFFEEGDEIGLRGAVLGEGGEFETITLSGPETVWKGGKIEFDENTNSTYSDGGVGYVKFGTARFVSHEEAKKVISSENKVHDSSLVAIPSLLDAQFEQVRQSIGFCRPFLNDSKTIDCTQEASSLPASKFHHMVRSDSNQDGRRSGVRHQLAVTATSTTITINNITSTSIQNYLDSNVTAVFSTSSNIQPPDSHPTQASTQLKAILVRLPFLLDYISGNFNISLLTVSHLTSTVLLLKRISDFTAVNPIYSQLYPTGLPNPPSRVTIAAPLPGDDHISLSLVLDICPREKRRGLHVQGRSYWAPANIGPYSQAIAVPLVSERPYDGERTHSYIEEYFDGLKMNSKLEIVHIAGQIPLIPATMEVHSGPFQSAAILSLQHLWRVGQERGVEVWPWAVTYLARNQNSNMAQMADMVSAIWTQAHLKPTWSSHAQPGDEQDDDSNDGYDDETSEVDIWDIQHNRSLQHGFRPSSHSVGKHLRILPNHTLLSSISTPSDSKLNIHKEKIRFVPPILAAEITDLPRNVDIEWWSNGIAGCTYPSTSSSATVGLDWQSKEIQCGSLSWLSVVPHTQRPEEKVMFLAYFISSSYAEPSATSKLNIPRTLADLMAIIDGVDDGEDEQRNHKNADLIQGTAYLCTSTTIPDMLPVQPYPLQPSTSNASQPSISNASHPLLSVVSSIPCYSLDGKALSRITIERQPPRSNRSEEQESQQPLIRNASGEDSRMTNLAAAFLLRVQTH